MEGSAGSDYAAPLWSTKELYPTLPRPLTQSLCALQEGTGLHQLGIFVL